MTLRALLAGLVGAMLISGLGYLNDRVLELESIAAGHLLPVLVMGSLILFVAGINPLLFRLRRGLAFRPAEVAVVLLMLMVTASGPMASAFATRSPSLRLR